MDLQGLTVDQTKYLKTMFRNRDTRIDDKNLDDLYEVIPDIDDILIERWDYISKCNTYDLTIRARMHLKLRA